MSLMTPFLGQTATLRRIAAGPDSWGNCTYTESSIDCRYEKMVKMFRLSESETWTSEAHIFADVELKEGDEITIGSETREIQKISHMPDLDGSDTFWEGWL